MGGHEMMVSTIVLNWNRAVLLQQVLRSYVDTVSGPAEIIVVDNASSDDSRLVINAARSFLPEIQAIFLDENIGGEAINICFDRATGDLIHLTENDQFFLVDWTDHAREAFDLFPDLGQLCFSGPVSTDEQAWEIQPCHMRFSRGKILYEADSNVSTSSVIRSKLIRDYNLRIYNLPGSETTEYKLPDNGRLSNDVKKAGYWCAWSDRYYVRNVGHEITEFARDRSYYEGNYASRPGLGSEAWERRVAAARLQPRVHRHSLVFPRSTGLILPEKTATAPANKSAQLWSMFDGWTAEIEVLDFLYALVRMTKPNRVLETGTWLGRSGIAIGSALRDNGFGHLLTIERSEEVATTAARNIKEQELGEVITLHVGKSLEIEVGHETYDFALFDSDIPLRATEFKKFYGKLEPGAIVVFHDTAEYYGGPDNVIDLMTMGMLEGIFLDTPRGIFVGKAVKPPRPVQSGVLRQLPYGFEAAAYLQANPDVAASGAEPGEHYRRYGWAEGRALAPNWGLDGIRLILTVTPGRSGTLYLCELLKAVPGIYSAHEPEPKFSDVMRAVQYDAAVARRFLLSQKLPAIRRCSQSTYVETSHLACKGFIEPLIDNGCPPDLIVLKRDPFLVATSLYLLATIPGRTPLGNQFLLRPDDASVLPLDGWQELSDWALCFWYCREIERRMEMYTNIIRGLGRRVITTSIARLQTGESVRELLEFVDASDSLLNDPNFVLRRSEKVNQMLEMKRYGCTSLSASEMVNWAKEVDARLAARRS
jgi:glycosyltransferase involved in cell wall biosynthesis/protein-L-isoaspartate O-methyltransferase